MEFFSKSHGNLKCVILSRLGQKGRCLLNTYMKRDYKSPNQLLMGSIIRSLAIGQATNFEGFTQKLKGDIPSHQ